MNDLRYKVSMDNIGKEGQSGMVRQQREHTFAGRSPHHDAIKKRPIGDPFTQAFRQLDNHTVGQDPVTQRSIDLNRRDPSDSKLLPSHPDERANLRFRAELSELAQQHRQFELALAEKAAEEKAAEEEKQRLIALRRRNARVINSGYVTSDTRVDDDLARARKEKWQYADRIATEQRKTQTVLPTVWRNQERPEMPTRIKSEPATTERTKVPEAPNLLLYRLEAIRDLHPQAEILIHRIQAGYPVGETMVQNLEIVTDNLRHAKAMADAELDAAGSEEPIQAEPAAQAEVHETLPVQTRPIKKPGFLGQAFKSIFGGLSFKSAA